MSNGEQSDLHQVQPPEEQERQIEAWVSKERSTGNIVCKELINWFAEQVHRRDRTGYRVTSAFAGEFLHRYPDLAKRLIEPPPPVLNNQKQPDRSPGARLRQRMQQERTRRMFGDKPPPERDPAPFPEGDIIHNIHNRYVIRHGDTVTKLTTNAHGFGPIETPNEAIALRFVKAHTTIPVPEVISSDWDRVTMEYIEGQTLQQAWPVLTSSQRSEILAQLSDYIAQMRSLGGISLGRLDGQGVVVPSFMERTGGPFGTLSEFHDWLASPLTERNSRSIYWHQITTQLGAEYPIVLTHADIAARNIMIRDGRIVAIIDWESAGWYPEYWEYVFAMRGMDHQDWETIGLQMPSLFNKRHDLEYILMGFILNL